MIHVVRTVGQLGAALGAAAGGTPRLTDAGAAKGVAARCGDGALVQVEADGALQLGAKVVQRLAMQRRCGSVLHARTWGLWSCGYVAYEVDCRGAVGRARPCDSSLILFTGFTSQPPTTRSTIARTAPQLARSLLLCIDMISSIDEARPVLQVGSFTNPTLVVPATTIHLTLHCVCAARVARLEASCTPTISKSLVA